MPYYDYHCPQCGEDCELDCSIADRDRQRCPHCGSRRLQRQVGACGINISGDHHAVPPACPTGTCPFAR